MFQGDCDSRGGTDLWCDKSSARSEFYCTSPTALPRIDRCVNCNEKK